MKTKLCFTIILISLFFPICKKANAQAPDWQWAKGIGGINYDSGNSIVIDASGNVYTTGSFNGTIDFDPGTGIFNLTSTGYSDIFICKLDSSGNFVWAKAIGGTDTEISSSISLDASGNVYTTGYFYDTVDFDPGAGTFNLTSAGYEDIFISKLDNSGNFVWAKAMSGGGHDWGYNIALDVNGNIYTIGWFNGTVDFDPGAGTFNLNSAGDNDIFISKFDNAGNFVWVKAMGGIDADRGYSIVIDSSGNVFSTGWFIGTVDFDPGPATYNITAAGSSDIFISQLDSSGNFVWAKAIGGTGDDGSYSISLDASSNIYITGLFSGVVDFDPDSLGTFNLTSAGYSDIFISKFDHTGNFIWAKAIGGLSYDVGSSISIDASGNIYTTGNFSGTVDFNPDSLSNFTITSSGYSDFFISKIDNMGNFVWALGVGGSDYDNGSSLVLDATGNAYLTGYFSSPYVFFGPAILLSNAGSGGDIFIAKLGTINTGIENIEGDNRVSLYPNPATNHLNISLENNYKKVNVTITDITGKIIYKTSTISSQKLEINTNDFAEGMYMVQVRMNDFVETKKVIVTK